MQSTLTSTMGAFPTRCNTVTAETLSQLLKGERITGMDGVFRCNTTRLAATVHHLKKSYGWDIESVDTDVGTDDGRISTVCVYSLTRATIRRAFDAGALAFCRNVASARAKLRSGATNAKIEAKRRNAARAAAKLDPNQGSLFGGAAHA